MKCLVATIKSWNIENFKKLSKLDTKNQWVLIEKKEDLIYEKLSKIKPRYIFFPHWSWIIPENIWRNFECIVFHMTDLPYGRGGTPLQNLILRRHATTKISALRVNDGIDTGDIYLKRKLGLSGKAEAIYKRMAHIIFFDMIPLIVHHEPRPQKQRGKVVLFTRRKPQQSKIPNSINSSQALYDFIRMLDAPTYPKAFIETKHLRINFYNAHLKKKGIMTAQVEIYGKK